tara:strand:- start:1289 stop:1666 length:378 start_codon:yes stop_codon:yes gene_type:complete
MPEWLFPISPVAASRPRVSRRGAYFAGPYKRFRKDMQTLVSTVIGEDFIPLESKLKVDLELFVTQPKTTKLSLPRADIDNYIKSIFDCCNGRVWVDDAQIKSVYAVKQWQDKGKDGYFILGVDEL